MTWQCRPWFGSTWSNSEQSGLVWSSLVLHIQICDDLTYLSRKFKEKTSSCICTNIAILNILKDQSVHLQGKAVHEITPVWPWRDQSHSKWGTTYPTTKHDPKSMVAIFLDTAMRTSISCSKATHFNIHLLFHCRSVFIKLLNWYVHDRDQRSE